MVKLLGNPQGSAVLFKEAFGTLLMREVGFAVPKWNPIEISDEFIDCNPGLWFESQTSAHQRPPAGLHFGSRLVVPGDAESLFELLPRAWFGLIRDREAFIGALLFDLWSNQTDNRQAIFVQNMVNRSINAIFIDQGCLFGTPTEPSQDSTIAMYLDRAIYANLDIDSIIPIWEARFRSLDHAKIKSIAASVTIPAQWYTSVNLDKVVSGMIERQSLLKAYGCRVKMLLSTHCSHEHLNAWNKSFDNIQIHGPHICSDGHRGSVRSVFRIG
ncbi:MAG: hypothetical protein ACRD28_11550 [Acidobacteriaceae bacterium]